MKALRVRHVVAFDASGVAGATLAWGLGGPRVRAVARAPLGADALWPSPFEPNARRRSEVESAAREVARSLALGAAPACLVLPDGVARLVDLDVPDGAVPAAYARYRLGASLPYPVEDAVVDVLPLGGRRVLAAAVRRDVLRDYEEVAAAAGLQQERVDLAPLGALAALGAAGPPGAAVDVVLGDAAVSLAVRAGGAVRAVRNRRRDGAPDEWRRLRADAERTAALAGEAALPRLRVVGAGALALLEELRAAGLSAEPGWRVAGDVLPAHGAELGWLGAALA
jgi:hypothetical protein